MKNPIRTIVLLGLFFLVVSSKVHAQTTGFELGIRNFYGAAFAMPMGENRIHASAAFSIISSNFGVDVLYDWQRPLPGFGKGWFFYPGVGISTEFASNFELGVAGEFGLEYQFEFPLSLSIEPRLILQFTNSNSNAFKGTGGFEARWRF